MQEDNKTLPETPEQQETKPTQEAESIRVIPDTAFMREQIKQRPVNRRRLLRRTLLTVLLAVIFGVVATLTFILLEPALNRALAPEGETTPDPVILEEPPAEEEVPPEALIREESELQREGEDTDVTQVLDSYVFDTEDYGEMMLSLRETATQASRSMVTITAVNSETRWSGDAMVTSGTTSGLIVSDNGYSYIILTDRDAIRNAAEIRVRFHNGTEAAGTYLSGDTETALAIVTVPIAVFSVEQRADIPIATLGRSSVNSLIGQPVIAIGEPVGVAGSILYGAVTTNARSLSLPDMNLQLLSTDMTASHYSNGALLNLRGEVIGFRVPGLSSHLEEDVQTQLHYYGISAIRALVEHLSNGNTRALLGVYGAEVPADIREEEEIPHGAYIGRVEINSPAMAAGIQSGDVITALSGTEITGFSSLSQALFGHAPEEAVQITLMRPGAEG
ncbi:MAG: trypsin-like peptidase domain-containing protein, partial [Lachnospiraceae bacterium]|nr:trypsin-like peptidase domain-containing protein [Lachnospiraceae bacterium]